MHAPQSRLGESRAQRPSRGRFANPAYRCRRASRLASPAMTPHPQVPRSQRVLVLIDFINPLDFPGAEKLAPGALRAARATLRLRDRLEREKVAVVYANDNYGVWQSDFHSLVSQCLGRKDT